MKAAIYLKNGVICKTNNLQKKLKREKEPIEILEEWLYNNDNQKLDDKYNYWCKTINYTEQPKEQDTVLHHFRNPKTGMTITSIYDDLENLKTITKDWMDYEKID